MQPDLDRLKPLIPIQPTDTELFRAIQAGEVEALGSLYDRYSRLVYGLALKILANSQEAEDLTQEVFLTLWQRQTYDPKRGSLTSFLITLTRSRSIDKLRSRSTRHRFLQRIQQGAVPDCTAVPLEQASLEERAERIQTALLELSAEERLVLEIAYYEGLSQSEIAGRLNIPLGTVKSRCRQGLLKLRRLLQDFIR